MLTMNTTIPASTTPDTQRISGATRYETAIEISKTAWSAGSSQYVLLATGEGWADALIANPLAAALGAPILLTPPTSLSTAVWNEIQRLGATKVIVLGSQNSVSGAVVSGLVARGIALGNIQRLGGNDRYDTAVRVAERVMIHRGSPEKVVIATGESYPDALAIAGYAARGGFPILLTRPTALPSATSRELDVIGADSSIVVGSASAVSASVANRLPSPTRIGGSNRYDTARLIAEYAFSNGMTYETVVTATGENYADALAAGPWVAKTGGMLALTASSALSQETDEFFNNHCTSIKKIYVAGGTSAVASSVVTSIRTAAETLMNADEVQLASPAAQSALETISPSGTLTFDDTVDPASLAVDKVLVGTPAGGAPTGYLRRVVSVTEAGGKVVVETAEATLADVILKGSIDVTGTVPVSQPPTPSSALSMSGARSAGPTSVDVDFDSMQMQAGRVDPRVSLGRAAFNFERTLYSNGPLEVKAEGALDFSADFTINAHFGIVRWHKAWWGWWPEYGLLEVSAVTSLSESLSVKILSDLTLVDFEREIELGRINLPTVTVWAGPVPIVFVNSITPVLGVSADLGANLEVGISQWAGCSLGVRWNYWSGWSPIKSFSSGYSFDLDGAVQANAKAWLGARLDVKLYGVAGPYFQPQAYLQFAGNTAANPWWTLDAGLEAKFGGRIDVLGRSASFGWTYDLYRRRLANAPGAFPSMAEAPVSGSTPVVGDFSGVNAPAISASYLQPGAIAAPILGDTVQAADFSIPGLAVTAASVVDADTVRLTTAAQTPGTAYTVSVAAGGISADDGSRSVASSKSFTGWTPLEVASVTAVSPTAVDVTFSTPASLDAATVAASDFDVPGLDVSAAVVQPDGTTVRLTTSEQTDLKRYRITCSADAVSDTRAVGNSADERGFLGAWEVADYASGPAGLAIDTDGRLWSWGSNTFGQLGDGTFDSHPTDPVRVAIDSDTWRDLETTRRSMFAIDGDGDLWAWGGNEFGQLGIGSTVAEPGGVATPTEVGAGIDWVDVEGGWYMTYGLDGAGNVYAWGDDNSGCLGNGVAGNQLTPQLVGTGYAQISAGKNHFVGIKTNGTLWGWGHNTVGELNGTPGMVTSPVQMSALTDWVDVSIGSYNTTALRSNGVVYYGGDNTGGTGGQGHTTPGILSFPTAVTVINDAVELESCTRTMMVERADGTLWTWGLGDGDDAGTPDSGTPRLRSAEDDWVRIGSDFYGNLFGIKPDGSPSVFFERRNDPPSNPFDDFRYLPEIEYVSPQSKTLVDVVFDTEPGELDAATVASGDFTISGLSVTAAVVQPDGKTVRLTTSSQTAGNAYVVAVGDAAVADTSGAECEATYGDFTGFANYTYGADGPLSHTRSIFVMRSPAPDICYATGMEGYVYVTTDGGASWTTRAGAATVRWNGYDLAFPEPANPNVMEMINYDGRINRTADYGTNWANYNLSAELGHPDGIDFAGDTGYGVVVDGGAMLRSTNGGTSWSVHPSQGTVIGSAVRFSNSTRGYVVGPNGRAWRSDDGGATWTEQLMPTASALSELWVSNIDPDHAVAVGAGGVIVFTVDGGETWRLSDSGVAMALSGISFGNEHVGFAVGNGPSILVTRDGGRTWSPILAGANASSYLSGVWANDPLSIWTAGLDSLDYKVTGN